MAFIKNFKCYACGSTLGKWNPGEEHKPGGARCFVCNACRGDSWVLPQELERLDWYSLAQVLGVEHGTVDQILPRLNTPGKHLSTARVKGGVVIAHDIVLHLADMQYSTQAEIYAALTLLLAKKREEMKRRKRERQERKRNET